MKLVRGGRTNYGMAIGVLMLDTVFPRIPGDIGNATTFGYPVCYRIVKGAFSHRIVAEEPDPQFIEPFVEAARELERTGVRLITTSCGFLGPFQPALAEAVSIPVLATSLIQVPMVSAMIGKKRRVGILTEKAHLLTENHFIGAGWSSNEIPVVVHGMPEDAYFPTVFIGNKPEADIDRLEQDMVRLGKTLVLKHPDVGAVVCECTNFVPFNKALQDAVNLPVFDIVTLVDYVCCASIRREFSGFL
ncbi:MAG: aspartate/glutamate racemase family protein [Deltaproteobacteria bacterium]|nr:aspartate/glutamate racemase family protein [Deltaproteobacteria bacterium]MBW2307154.1 aspartate/glutamate racemase family protein [Deltaproteobacteria bacterium]